MCEYSIKKFFRKQKKIFNINIVPDKRNIPEKIFNIN